MRLRRGICATAVLLSLLMGCSKPDGEGVATVSGAQPQQSADPSAPSDNPEERVRQWVACMRAEGIEVPDPEPGDRTGKSALVFEAPAGDKAKIGAAIEKCHRYMPDGGQAARQPLTAEEIEERRRSAQCMRENGFPDFPDPNAEGRFENGPDKTDPAVRAAMEKCMEAR
jgi:hypothetical protein